MYTNTELVSAPESEGAVEFEAHIPWVGLALIDRHTERLRKAAEAAYEVRSSLSFTETLAQST